MKLLADPVTATEVKGLIVNVPIPKILLLDLLVLVVYGVYGWIKYDFWPWRAINILRCHRARQIHNCKQYCQTNIYLMFTLDWHLHTLAFDHHNKSSKSVGGICCYWAEYKFLLLYPVLWCIVIGHDQLRQS